ncbi:AAA family ATPase [Mumia sp. zg.B53]|uniref:AAA family ATPase n=1 Tax=Mumia sp. zg.B53 TaxID=2855449 RepID=UPI001C6F3574|nr:ATP-binding protein [Mumia sp. zg.B53]MBW9216749.1 AAA family ATPase [Mumia sp. zg.B53]
MTLRHFRGVQESTVRFGDGVTVVVGPNEAGKSSVAEAVRLLRTTKSSSRSQAVRDVKPVGLDVGPEAEVELRTGPYALVYRKRWLKSPMTELDVTAPSREQHSGDEAHQRFAAILSETVDVDLWEALEIVQGESLDQPELARISALHRALDDSAGATGDHDALMAAVLAERDRLLTAGGKPRGAHAQSAAEIVELEAEAARLRARSAEMDRYVDDYAANEHEHARLSTLSIEADARLRRSEDAVRALETLREELRRSEEDLEVAERALSHAVRARDDRRSMVDDLARRAETIDALRTRVAEVVAAHSDARTAEDDARREVGVATERARVARHAAQTAALAVARHRDELERTALAQRVRRAREAGERCARARAEREVLRVDDAVLARLTDLSTDVQVAVGARDAAAARVSVRPLGGHRVDVGGAEVVGETYEASVLDDVRITVDGVVEVVVSPGTPPADLDRRVARARAAFDVALHEAGVDSLDEARSSHERRRVAESQCATAEDSLSDALGGTTLDDLELRLATLERRRPSDPSAEPSAEPSSDPSSEGERDALEAAADAARSAAEDADADAAAARDAHDGAREALSVAGEASVRARQELESAEHELARETARLAAARAEVDDEALTEAVVAADEAYERARTTSRASRATFEAASPETLAMELANARELVEGVDRDLTRTDERRVELQTLLDDRAAEGIHDRLTDVEAALAVASATHRRLARSAQAADLLSATLLRHRDEAQRHYVAPFKQRIDRLGKVVFGPDFEVEVSTDLAIETRTLRGRTVPFGSLSGGAREQLAVLGRLACAQLVDPDEGAPVILDDTLGFSDPDRLERLAVVLNDVGRSAQVVLLTCQPRRFESVGGARTERLTLS